MSEEEIHNTYHLRITIKKRFDEETQEMIFIGYAKPSSTDPEIKVLEDTDANKVYYQTLKALFEYAR